MVASVVDMVAAVFSGAPVQPLNTMAAHKAQLGRNGNAILSYTPELDFTVVILSAPEIKSGESYVLNVGGSTGTFVAK